MFQKWVLSGVAVLGLLVPLTTASAAEGRHDRDHDRDHDHDHCYPWQDHCYPPPCPPCYPPAPPVCYPPVCYPPQHCCYEVMYRPCCCDPWNCYGHYDCHEQAEHVEHYLRAQGFEAFVRK